MSVTKITLGIVSHKLAAYFSGFDIFFKAMKRPYYEETRNPDNV